MKKLIVLIVLFFASREAFAWSISCTNGSCEGSYGRIKIFWAANNMNGDGIYFGRLTGVEGLPVSIEDFKNSEQKMDEALQKSISLQKTKTDTAGIQTPVVTSNVTDNTQELFSKGQTASSSQSKGQGITYDITLKFLRWIADRYVNGYGKNNVRRYMAASEIILSKFENGQLPGIVDIFMFSRQADKLDRLPIDTPINEENKQLVQTKYFALTRLDEITDLKEKYSKAYTIVNSGIGEGAEKLNADYKADMEALKILCEPGQTAYALGKGSSQEMKNLSFVKWLGDGFKDYSDPKDAYIVALTIARSDDKTWVNGLREQYEKAMASKDPSVLIEKFRKPPVADKIKAVTGKTNLSWRTAFEAGLVLAVIVLGIMFLRMRKKMNLLSAARKVD